ITDKFIGGLLSGGGGYPSRNTPEGWSEMVNGFQEYALRTRLGIPLIYGVDAVHGHGNLRGATIFPHNIGLGATRDPDLVERIGQTTAVEMAATGIYWNFAPVVAVPQDIRWGRTYEGYSENTELVSKLGAAYIKGLQNVGSSPNLSAPTTVLATAKHFVGDGGTAWGSSDTFIMQQFMLDQGVTDVDEATLRAVHLSPYVAAIDTGAMSIMVSFSSWGGMKMHAQKYLLTDVLKGELDFKGFLVADWQGIDQIPGNYYSDIVTSINAGLDMIMVPYDYDAFINGLTEAVNNGDVPLERIDDAVRRILTVKFQLGLFERPFADESLLPLVRSDEHRELAREAVRKSLVLLKNDNNTLPLAKDTPLIFVAGQGANDIGIQSGGWTIEWQGKSGDITPGTTILEAIRNTVSENTIVLYNRWGEFDRVTDEVADVGIVVMGEMPYAEGVGDDEDLTLSEGDIAVIERVREGSKKVVVILISGRPMIVTEHLDQWDVFIAAWLPGTEGQGVADVLFGDYPFTGKLPYTWPRAMDQIPFDFDHMEPT
ncbi:MAG: glycoside hydrolase family 3 protein, partial [Dehalococcoidia bacterium]|nr:glycoside hydrolase family 3 protein [Dehalococcoidia bacterium]